MMVCGLCTRWSRFDCLLPIASAMNLKLISGIFYEFLLTGCRCFCRCRCQLLFRFVHFIPTQHLEVHQHKQHFFNPFHCHNEHHTPKSISTTDKRIWLCCHPPQTTHFNDLSFRHMWANAFHRTSETCQNVILLHMSQPTVCNVSVPFWYSSRGNTHISWNGAKQSWLARNFVDLMHFIVYHRLLLNTCTQKHWTIISGRALFHRMAKWMKIEFHSENINPNWYALNASILKASSSTMHEQRTNFRSRFMIGHLPRRTQRHTHNQQKEVKCTERCRSQ